MGDYEFGLREDWRRCVNEVRELLKRDPEMSIQEVQEHTRIDWEFMPEMYREAKDGLA